MFEYNKSIIEFFFQDKNSDLDLKYLDKNNLLDYYNEKKNKTDDIEFKKGETIKMVKLFNQMENQTGVNYFAMKTFLSYVFYDHDIDFIITEKGYSTYIKELKSKGFSTKYDLSNIREPLKMLYKSSEHFITPHMHRHVSWNGIIACDKKEVYKSAIDFKLDEETSIKIPCPTDELLIAIGHFLFENYYFKIGELVYFNYLLNKDIDYERIEKFAETYGYRKGVDLFFSYLKGISDSYDLNLNIKGKYVYNVSIDKEKPFPYFIPYKKLIPTYIENFKNGVKRGLVINLFRKMFTFTLVGYLWKYKLPLRRQRKSSSQYQG